MASETAVAIVGIRLSSIAETIGKIVANTETLNEGLVKLDDGIFHLTSENERVNDRLANVSSEQMKAEES